MWRAFACFSFFSKLYSALIFILDIFTSVSSRFFSTYCYFFSKFFNYIKCISFSFFSHFLTSIKCISFSLLSFDFISSTCDIYSSSKYLSPLRLDLLFSSLNSFLSFMASFNSSYCYISSCIRLSTLSVLNIEDDIWWIGSFINSGVCRGICNSFEGEEEDNAACEGLDLLGVDGETATGGLPPLCLGLISDDVFEYCS